MGSTPRLVVLKSAMEDPGAQCVMTCGTVMMPVSCAANWGSQDTVRQTKRFSIGLKNNFFHSMRYNI